MWLPRVDFGRTSTFRKLLQEVGEHSPGNVDLGIRKAADDRIGSKTDVS
jgi:hypothetical protein